MFASSAEIQSINAVFTHAG